MNITLITGNLGKDPEVRYTQDSKKVVFISVATTEYKKAGNDGFKEITTWHPCTAMGYAADKLEKQAQKGSRVEITGHYVNVKVKDGAGIERKSMELRIDKVDVVAKRKGQSFDGGSPSQQSPVHDGFSDGSKNGFSDD